MKIKNNKNKKMQEPEEFEATKTAKRKMPSFGKICIVILIAILVSIVLARYVTEEEFREKIDTNIFKKEVTSDNLDSIDLDSENNPSIYAFSNYITVLSKGSLKIYNSKGKLADTVEINISSPVVDSEGKFLVIAENSGSKIYLLNDTNLIWQTEVEGEISGVNVNKNGYVSVIIKNTTYKSIVVLFNTDGKEIFRKYLSSTYAICSDISADNKYLAIGEVDYSGTIVKSNVEIISVALALSDSANSIVNKYVSSADEIITNLKYIDKQNVICMFNTYIQKVNNSSDSLVYEISSDDIFLDINIKGKLAIIEKQSSGMFSYDYQMKVKSEKSSSEHLYILNNSIPKTIICYGNNVGINFGTEVQIVNSSGWPMKKYTASKEIKSLVLGENIAGIVYKDKIDIIKF
jgi:hypothetical protein